MIEVGIFNFFCNKLSEVYPMHDIDRELCYQYFEYFELPKNTLYEKQGEIPQYQNYILSGFMRKFHTDVDGNEITVEINSEPRFIASYMSLMERKPATETLQTITDCKILRIKRDDMDIVFEKGISVKQYTIQLFQNIIEEKNRKAFELATLSAEERYVKLLREAPQIVQNVPIQYIASLLGMKPESLSRIRKKLNK
ncbi:MAG: Crp/Fnr family transcriptional regulator [Bacteroidia bacterium]|nr:MAG: Crp/Fnr family transcriptional regulator [Bacteroidia bacterium]